MRYKIFFLFMPAVSLLSSCNPGPEKPAIKTKYSINRDRITDSAAKLDTLYITGGLTSTFIYDDSGQIKSILHRMEAEQLTFVPEIQLFPPKPTQPVR